MSQDCCMNQGDGMDCHGPLSSRFSGMGSRLTRCARHWARRDANEEKIRELESPFPAPWFDPLDAGEAWDNDEGTGLGD